ncbi:uncharacterized protein LOC128295437 [Gossypium arboreum]|uniref:uncharacterized protein LOC128295437 n=1 Tax=Gossypium arboreum TaxID=29729 RepID=UPI0022F14FA3|nr:uncharacterized protein LOC128295437 [Gossypium arboreum]
MGNSVFLKVLRFGRKRKLSPRFIGPYRVARWIGTVAYQLELPPELGQIHDVFHVSMLRRYHSDPSHVMAIEEIKVRPDLTFEEESIQIIGRDVKVLRRKGGGGVGGGSVDGMGVVAKVGRLGGVRSWSVA